MSNISKVRSQDRSAVGTGRRRAQRGFTLLELVTTVTVAGVLLVVAVPSFFNTSRNSHAAADANELVSAFSIARSEAIRRGARIGVCSSSNGTACGGTWADGWIVYTDTATSDTATTTGVGTVLRVSPPPTGTPAITGGSEFVRFLPRGYARSKTGAMPVIFTIKVQGCGAQQGRTVEVNGVGRATAARVNCP
ncbi:MAG TPA: GspH/FimT family pseudopilin [Gammaproteobacteria bacterium]|nr:GspH/FimT family pseudopilin [Gammaproteobacteria bacterium]